MPDYRVSLPILVVREFIVYGQKLSIVDGVNALLGEGDWPLAGIRVLFEHTRVGASLGATSGHLPCAA